MPSAFKSIGTDAFDGEVLGAGGSVLVFFWAPSSAPCRAFIPPLEQHVAERRSSLNAGMKLVKVNVEEHPELAKSAKIGGVPALVLYRSGKIEDALIGTGGPRDLDALLAKA